MAERLPRCLNHRPGEIAVRVKMLVTRGRTERPRDLYYSLTLVSEFNCVGYGGAREVQTPVWVEALLKYHSVGFGYLTCGPDRVEGQCLVGSLTGAVASLRVTEAPKGSLSLVGNQVLSVSAQGSLTVRLTGRAGTKVGTSDPALACGRGGVQRITRTSR